MVNVFARCGRIRVLLALLILSCVVLTALPVFGDESVTLSWNASPSANVASYNVYYGGASTLYTNMLAAGNNTSIQINGLVEGKTYYFVATAVDLSGIESDFSAEVAYWVPST